MNKMKVLLLNPPMDFEAALGKADKIAKYTVMIPQGLASIAAVLERNAVECLITDAYAENLTLDVITDRIIDYNPDVLGLSCVTPVVPIVHEVIKRIKDRKPSIIVVLGGPHPSILPDEELDDTNVDYIVKGEGEFIFLNLLNELKGGRNFSRVDGLSYRENGKKIHNKTAENIDNLELLPQPAYHLLPMHLYSTPPQWSLASPSFQLLASRGCVYQCGFCYVGMGKRMRYKNPKTICDEIEYLIKNYGCRQIVFVDTIFPISDKHANEVCKEIINRQLNKKIVWFTSTRVDVVNQDMLNLMHRAGCRLVTFGVESGNQEILDCIKKHITLEQTVKAVKMAHKAKIDVTASYVLGLPGETIQTVLDTIKFAKKLNTLYAQFNIIVPYPGTEVYEYAVKNGLLRNRNWSNYVSLVSMTELDPPFIAPGMTKEELLDIQKRAYRGYYLRPVIIFKHIRKMLANREFAKYFSMFDVLLRMFKKS